MINSDLREAYYLIKNIYQRLEIEPPLLKQVVFLKKWNFVCAESGEIGVAFNFTGEHAVYGSEINFDYFIELQVHLGRDLFEFIEYLLNSSEIQMRSVCLATLNLLSQAISSNQELVARGISLVTTHDFSFINSEDVVTVVGYGGVIDKLYGNCKELNVLDMRPKSSLQTLIIGEDIEYGPQGITFYSTTESQEVLNRSDIVMLSGCTLVNGTCKELVAQATKARVKGVFGPSGQIVPEFLFKLGINYISSNRFIKSIKFYRQFTNPVYQLKNKLHQQLESYVVKSESFPD